MKYFLIMNPGSRGGKSKAHFDGILSFFKEKRISYEFEVTKSLTNAKRISREVCKKGSDVVVVVGGDGTINHCLNGFFDENGRLISSSRLGVIYTGTSPDFCRSYGIPTDTSKALKILANPVTTDIAVGMIRYAASEISNEQQFDFGKSDHFATSFFACCANIGIGAEIARFANGGIRSVVGDSLGTLVSLVKSLVKHKPEDIQLQIDGDKQVIRSVYNISVGKTFYVASGIRIRNDLNPDDDRLYVLSVKNLSIWNAPLCVKRFYDGKPILNNDVLDFRYGKKIRVLGKGNVAVEFDGDPSGFLPCEITTAPDRIKLITGQRHAV